MLQRRTRARGLGVCACLGLAGPLTASATLAHGADATATGVRPGLLARIPDGRRLNFRCVGQGPPTVILESGFAATSLAWVKVQPPLARTFRVCAYDRAGYGFSDPGPEPRDGNAIVSDLDQGLRAARIAGPFILVGHSAGALYVRLFAQRRPGAVLGMVLVDPSVEYQDKRYAERYGPAAGVALSPLRARAAACLEAAKAHALPSADPKLAPCAPAEVQGSARDETARERLAEALRPSTWRTQLSELDSLWRSTSQEVASGRQDYGAIPMIVLTAGSAQAASTPASPEGHALAFWRGLHSEIAARSRRGLERLVSPSTHMMMFDRPDAIVAAVNEVAAMAVSPQPAGGSAAGPASDSPPDRR